MICPLKTDRWSPYTAGIAIAGTALLSLTLFGKMLGASGFFVKIAAAIWYVINPDHLIDNAYYAQALSKEPFINFYFMLAIGVFIGSWIASKSSGGTTTIYVPTVWQNRFGPSKAKRNVFAFLGGIILLFGARLAGGCTSGLGLSGGMQLSATAFIFMAALFATGVPTALLLYKKAGK